MYTINHNGVFQQFLLFVHFEDVFQHTLAKWPVAVQAFGQTQMHDMLSFYGHFSETMLKSAVGGVGIVGNVVSSSAITSSVGHGMPYIISSDLSYCEIFKVGVDVAQDILFRTFAITLVHNDLYHIGHVHPEQFECFGVTHKHLIAVFQCVSEDLEHSLFQFIQCTPGTQLLLDDGDFGFCGFFFEKQVKGRVVLFVGLSAKLADDVQGAVDLAVYVH